MRQKKIVVLADKSAEDEFLSRTFPGDCRIVTIRESASLTDHQDAWLCFILSDETSLALNGSLFSPETLVFISGVENVFQEKSDGFQYVRLNTWPGFLKNPILEIAAPQAIHTRLAGVMEHLGWKYRLVANIPGMVTPRVIAMIINEACLAVHEKVSTKEEIDIAMKSGTNYPFGPFEWVRKIGAKRIISLLNKLAATDPRYNPAPGIEKMLTPD